MSKKTVYEEVVKKFNATDTSELVKKTDYDNKIGEGKIPSVTGLATATAAENKKSGTSTLVKSILC